MNLLKKLFKADPEVDYQYALKEDMKGNYKKAYWLFEKAAQSGLVKAQFECGHMCLKGRGIKKDISKAFDYTERAASQDYYKAQYLLSQMYLFQPSWVFPSFSEPTPPTCESRRLVSDQRPTIIIL